MGMTHYRGSCQCCAVSFEADANLEQSVTCNCSRCQRLGSVLAFTARGAFVLKSGEENLSEYLFKSRKIHHLFCKTCGIQRFAYGKKPDGSSMVALNVNCLDGVNPRALSPHFHNGTSA